jgi:hypothetical protein
MPIFGNIHSFPSGKFALELDGTHAGWLTSVEGGHAGSYVFSCGAGMSRAFYDWIKANFNQQYVRKSGAVVTTDHSYQVMNRINFNHALITEIGFPALDASSKDAAKMTIKFEPEYTSNTSDDSGGGSVVHVPTHQKLWLPSHFHLSIAGLDDECHHVNKIDAITIKQKMDANPNLSVTVAESHSKGFKDWFQTVLKGTMTTRPGTLDYLAADSAQALFTLSFPRLGIDKVTIDKLEAASDGIRHIKVEMYCEEMHFDTSIGFA